ncbi:MAG: hypothetical protein RIR97_1797 [Pseudomonadota bacterium]
MTEKSPPESQADSAKEPAAKPVRRRRHVLLRLDSLIDSSVWNLGFRVAELWEDITIFFRRFRVRGIRRLFVELFDEALTFGAAGFVIVLALAQPAFDLTKTNWRQKTDFAVTFLDRYGNVIGHRGIFHNDGVPVDQLPDHLVKALLATEDRRFFDHFGIDFLGLARALSENARAGGVVQGGSTLTQQLAKNLFLSNERSFERKINEAFLALWLESNLSKKDILSFYLDRAYMGGGTFGVAAAADYYFGKSVTDLDLAESAMLAGLFKAPTKYSPHVNLPAARARANEVLTNLVQSGMMTEGQVIAARRNPASVVDRQSVVSPDFFLDWAFEDVQRIAGPMNAHSLVVRTTIDMGLQRAAEEAVETGLRQYGEGYNVREGAMVMIENGGAVRAMVGGRDYGESQFNRATQALRQPGSSFKVYTYALAMENGFTPDSVLVDGPITWNGWSPQNYARSYSGSVTLTTALAKSINSIPVRLAKDYLGTKPIAQMALNMGVETPIRTDKTMPLGTSEVTVLDQATAYAVFPAGGLQSMRHGISQIMDYKGQVLFDVKRDMPLPKKVLSEQAVASMNQILTQIPVIGTARKAALNGGIVTGGKTGTTQAYRDAWFVGFTGNYTTAVWFGNDDYTSTNKMTGGSLPAITFKRFMDYAHQGIELRPIPGINNALPGPETAGPDLVSGEPPDATLAPTGPDDAALAPLVRPRSLSSQSTRILQDLQQKLKEAMPLKEPDKVAVKG